MPPGVILYRHHTGVDFAFRFVHRPESGWRVYIEDQPPYRGRSTDLHSTHRLIDGGRHFICWDRAIEDFEDAKWIAKVWADATMDYIATARPMAPPAQREQPRDVSALAGMSERELRAALTEPTVDSSGPANARPPTPTGVRRDPTTTNTSSSVRASSSPIRRFLERLR